MGGSGVNSDRAVRTGDVNGLGPSCRRGSGGHVWKIWKIMFGSHRFKCPPEMASGHFWDFIVIPNVNLKTVGCFVFFQCNKYNKTKSSIILAVWLTVNNN